MTDKETTFVPSSATFCSIEAMEQSGVAIAKSEREKVKLEAKVLAEKTANLSEAKYLLAEFQKYVNTVTKNSETKAGYETYLNVSRLVIRKYLEELSTWQVNVAMAEQIKFVTEKVQECLSVEAEAKIKWEQHEQFVDQFKTTVAKINELIPGTRAHGFEQIMQMLTKNVELKQKEKDEQESVAQTSAYRARNECFARGRKYDREVEELENLIAEKLAKKEKCFALHDEIEF